MRRKLTTIVAADIVGYSRLLGEEEDATLAAIDLLRTEYIEPKASTFSGRIFRFLGDGTLLEFESVLGAVEFAIDLQKSLAAYNASSSQQIPIVLRIGINLGDVVFENGDIHGDGVNIAVRLEALAEPGGICLADSVHAQIRHKIANGFIAIGPRNLKNIVDRIDVWRWRPATGVGGPKAARQLDDEKTCFNGQHVLDPKVVDLLLRLHARSALLAVSNALDAVIDEEKECVTSERLYYHLSEQLHLARSMLDGIQIERVDNYQELAISGAKRQTLGEFVSSMCNDSKLGYAFKIIPEVQAILAGNQSWLIKRKRFLDLVRKFHDEDHIARCRGLIKYAFID